MTTQYEIDKRIEEEGVSYEMVVAQARENGVVSIGWVQQVFHLQYSTAARFVESMTDEGICEEFTVENQGWRKIIIS